MGQGLKSSIRSAQLVPLGMLGTSSGLLWAVRQTEFCSPGLVPFPSSSLPFAQHGGDPG